MEKALSWTERHTAIIAASQADVVGNLWSIPDAPAPGTVKPLPSAARQPALNIDPHS